MNALSGKGGIRVDFNPKKTIVTFFSFLCVNIGVSECMYVCVSERTWRLSDEVESAFLNLVNIDACDKNIKIKNYFYCLKSSVSAFSPC